MRLIIVIDNWFYVLQVTSYIILSFLFALARKSDNETACLETKIDEARKSDNETACSETTNDRTEKRETSGFTEPLSSKKTTGKILSENIILSCG